MGNGRNLWLVILVSGGACVESESGVGHTSTDGTGDGPVSGSAYVEPEEPTERSYLIAESMDYTNNGCTNIDDLIDVTSSLWAALAYDGWSGTRMTEAMTVPADFVDSFNLVYGRDDMGADSVRLSVYAGHGYMNSISWGTRDTNPELSKKQGCRARFSDGVRLGRMAGGMGADRSAHDELYGQSRVL